MKNLRGIIYSASIVVFLICVYSFLLGNNVFKGKFSNEPIAWYFLAKGIFCSIALFMMLQILTSLNRRN
ncbi:MAG: hypothetical protein ABH883_09775 [Candidatus Omnitrophota bacterium]